MGTKKKEKEQRCNGNLPLKVVPVRMDSMRTATAAPGATPARNGVTANGAGVERGPPSAECAGTSEAHASSGAPLP